MTWDYSNFLTLQCSIVSSLISLKHRHNYQNVGPGDYSQAESHFEESFKKEGFNGEGT